MLPALSVIASTIAVSLLAAGLYGLVWRASQSLDRTARMLARALPVAAIVPGVYTLSLALAPPLRPAEASPAGMARAVSPAPAPAAPPAVRRPIVTPPPAIGDVAGTPADSGAHWDVVPVLYGTDRARQAVPTRLAYGPERARRLELGRAIVTVPAAHRVPSIERPFAVRVPYFQVVLFEQDEDPRKHFTIKELKDISRADFLALARARLGGGSAFRDQALVFVHGYNTDFDAALFRTAQLAYDLKFDGGVFLYSWPSAGGVAGYALDRESATQAEPYLKEFLALVVRETGAKGVSVIAHSMGNLPLLNVLRDLGPSLPPGVRLNEVVLAAPDVDRDVFLNLAGAIRGMARGLTLYCSANDRAMTAARSFAGGVPRAGDVPADGPVIVPGVDTIDVTGTSTDVLALNHSLYAERSALLNDIGLLLQTGERPPEVRVPVLQRVRTGRGDFWRYP
jgi:esterase/lipase superfamily enzyme